MILKQAGFFLLLTAATFNASAADEMETLPEHWQLWLQQLPELLQQQSATSQIYMKNYLQCMDDQQALKQSPEQSLVESLKNALASGEACQPLLEAWLKALTENTLEDSSPTEKSL
ncbi:hypothetical protein ACFVYJ_06875 [Pontibacter sp. JAM-7]|uniref:hypothetical protein n=1 Tax=Pontibacter sp. JAM-7 TaxID=3366581 RepID=UPI003AF755B3